MQQERKSNIFSWFWFTPSVCLLNQKLWQAQCAVPPTGAYHPPLPVLNGEQQYAVLHSAWTKKSLFPESVHRADVSFPLGARMAPKGLCVPIGNRSVKLITKNKNSRGNEMTLEGGKENRETPEGCSLESLIHSAGGGLFARAR